jgi:signal transduction histidine kinase
MSSKKEFPRNFWDRDDVTPMKVLGDILNEVRQPTKLIIGYSELLSESDLSDEQRTYIETILERAQYLETILDAGIEYGKRTVNLKSGNEV